MCDLILNSRYLNKHSLLFIPIQVVWAMQRNSTRICFIFNPAADRNRSQQHIKWLNKAAHERWKAPEIYIIGKNEDITETAHEKSHQFEVVVACGGDGTIHKVINGITGTETALGVLPIGSGNDFVKSAGLNKTPAECLHIIDRGLRQRIDLIRFEGDVSGWCANTIGMGLDGWANYYAHQNSLLKGGLRYIYGAIRAAITFKGTRVILEIDGNVEQGELLMVTACNGKWEGGNFLVAPHANNSDGKLDLLTISTMPLAQILAYLPRFKWGPSAHMNGVSVSTFRHLRYSSNKPIAVHCDGEELGTHIRDLRLFVSEKILDLIVPDTY